MADEALLDAAQRAVERLWAPLEQRLKHIEDELKPVRMMANELSRIGQELRDRDARHDEVKTALVAAQKDIRELRTEVDQNKWISRVAVALLIAGAIAWFQRGTAQPPIYVNVAPISASPSTGP